MKNLFLMAVSTLVFSLSAPAFGARQAPLYSAVMEEQDADGHVLNENHEFRLEMFGKTGSNKPASFVLTETPPTVFCIQAPCPQPPTVQTRYEVRTVIADRCGSQQYVGYSVPTRSNPRFGVIRVVDHATRVCKDYKKYQWEVKLQSGARPRLFFGTPAPTVNTSNCMEKLLNTACIMLYLPATCEASTVDNRANKIDLLRAEAGNSCAATNALKIQACERGIDPDRFGDDDIMCSVHADPIAQP